MDTQRLILYALLGFVALMIYQQWQVDYVLKPRLAAQQEAELQAVNENPQVDPKIAAAPHSESTLRITPSTSESASVADSVTAAPANLDAQEVTVATDVLNVPISSVGGSIIEARLPQYPVSIDDPNNPFTLMSNQSDRFYIAESGIEGVDGVQLPTRHSNYAAAQSEYVMGAEQNELVVPLTWQVGDLQVTKRFIFRRGDYAIDVEHEISNATEAPIRFFSYQQLQRSDFKESGTGGEQSRFGAQSYTGGVVSFDGTPYEKVKFGGMRKENYQAQGVNGWVAMNQHYFTAAWAPGERASALNFYSRVPGANRYVLGYYLPATEVPAGQSTQVTSTLYAGPKVQDKLEAVAERMKLLVDFGWLTMIAQVLFWLLQKIHAVIGNWGFAIILLTICVKALFYKLSETSYRSMAKMRKLQPRMVALREQYSEDRQKLAQVTMDLYKKEKVNPMGGCFPMLVQIPFFIALYWVLLESVELRQAPWLGWIQDLAIKDPYFILPLIMGVSMFAQQKLNPPPPDPIQARVFMMMPVIFTVFFAFFPAGLVLYWVTNNLLSIAQQWYITRVVLAEGK